MYRGKIIGGYKFQYVMFMFCSVSLIVYVCFFVFIRMYCQYFYVHVGFETGAGDISKMK